VRAGAGAEGVVGAGVEGVVGAGVVAAGGAVTVTGAWQTLGCEFIKLTVAVTVKVPEAEYVCVWENEVVEGVTNPSPKSNTKPVIIEGDPLMFASAVTMSGLLTSVIRFRLVHCVVVAACACISLIPSGIIIKAAAIITFQLRLKVLKTAMAYILI
jgi:hypothetical protein